MSPARAGRLAAGAFAAGSLGIAYGVGIERRWYAIRHERLPVLRCAGQLRVLLFSDLHFVPGQDHRLDFIRRVAEEHGADLVVSGGDNLEDPDAISPIVDLHREVLAVTGAPGVAVLGAHDRYGPQRGNPARYLLGPSAGPSGELLDTRSLVSGMESGGWQVLLNQTSVVDTAAGPVELVGVDDPHIRRDDVSIIPDSPTADVVLRLGLVHAPYLRVLERYDRAGMDLALAGHTHGGQLAIPGWGALVSNSDLPARQAKGTSHVGAGLHLHVSAGLGHSRYAPIRFACRPELSILDLVPRDDA